MKYIIISVATAFLAFSCEKLNFKKADTNFTENCIDIGELELAQNSDGEWELLNDGQFLKGFPNYEEAVKTKDLMEFYQVSKECSCGWDAPMEFDTHGNLDLKSSLVTYHLTNDGLGIGNEEYNSYSNEYEDCLPFNPDKLVAKQRMNGDWYLIEKPGHLMFHFGKDKEACFNTLKAIKKYKYNQSCFVGRPYPSFQYLKRQRDDFPSYRPGGNLVE